MVELQINVEKQVGSLDLRCNVIVPANGCTGVFGPSGSGKTSLLRLISGMDRPDRGVIRFDDTVIVDTHRRLFAEPYRRNIGYMFQDTRLFPHLSVAQNLAYGQKRQTTINKNTVDRDFVVEALNLTGMLPRHTSTLSGGEAKRVALARALLSQPQLLLLDEPFNGLDDHRKRDASSLLQTVKTSLNIPIILVSHSVADLAALADRALHLENGHVRGLGDTAMIIQSAFADSTLQSSGVRILRGATFAHDEAAGLTRVAFGESIISIPLSSRLKINETVLVAVDARDVSISKVDLSALSIRNKLKAKITEIENDINPAFCLVQLITEGGVIASKVTREACDELQLNVGDAVFAFIKSASLAH